jgi:hypothetical protein
VAREPDAGADQAAGAVADLRRTDPRRLRARLRGDLDTITRTALRTEPSRRYATVRELVADIQRHRTGRPVAARPDRWHYRSGKFARRNPAVVAGVCAVAVLATAYLITLTVHADRLEAQRDLARLEARKAGEVKQFLLGVFDLADPGRTRGETVTARAAGRGGGAGEVRADRAAGAASGDAQRHRVGLRPARAGWRDRAAGSGGPHDPTRTARGCSRWHRRQSDPARHTGGACTGASPTPCSVWDRYWWVRAGAKRRSRY